MVDSKFSDEPLTFGQAVVTHHFLAQLQNSQKQQQQSQAQHQHQQQSQNFQSLHSFEPVSQSQHLSNLNHSASILVDNHQTGKQVVQFDLLQKGQPEYKPYYGRKKLKFEEEAKTVKDAFFWDDGQQQSLKYTKMKEIQRSPAKWKTEQRDNYRQFADSPSKENKEPQKNSQIPAKAQNKAGNQTGDQREKDRGQDAKQDQLMQPQLLDENQADEKVENQIQGRQVRISNDKDDKKKLKRPQSAQAKKRPISSQKLKSQNMDKRIANLNSTTRWLPDSAFTTYFGKPAFHIYGKGNINPTVGGNVYGHYLLTHNVNPESGEHLPQYQQVYDTALKKGMTLNNGLRVPHLPRKVREETRLTLDQVEEINNRNPIMPKDRSKEDKGLHRTKTISIQKPNLAKQKYFNSKHTTPDVSMEQAKIFNQKKNQTKSQNVLPQIQEQIEANDNQLDIESVDLAFNNQGGYDLQNEQILHPDLVLSEGQDIGEADQVQQLHPDSQNHQLQNQQVQNYIPLCQLPVQPKTQTNELNPRNYQFVPACWTQRIRPAGKLTYKSEAVYNVITQIPMQNNLQSTI